MIENIGEGCPCKGHDLLSKIKYWADEMVNIWQQLETFVCGVISPLPSGALLRWEWLTRPRDAVSSAAKGSCWGSPGGLSDILKGCLPLQAWGHLGTIVSFPPLFFFFPFVSVGF